MANSDCIFCKIRDREIPKEFDYEDEDVMVFPDINPSNPVHILVVPKKHLVDFMEVSDEDLTMKINNVIKDVIKREKLTNKGFNVSTNGGGYQIIDHVHFHVKGPMGINESL